jgi:hypothetical protein
MEIEPPLFVFVTAYEERIRVCHGQWPVKPVDGQAGRHTGGERVRHRL